MTLVLGAIAGYDKYDRGLSLGAGRVAAGFNTTVVSISGSDTTVFAPTGFDIIVLDATCFYIF